jgi:cyclopropane fatty-acyl-phospholipid synthase-like methyltransferase
MLELSREAARLGLSTVDELNALQIERFATWDVFLDVERIFAGLEPWEARSIEDFFTGGRRLLVGCVGAGRELAALDKMGFDVDAFDCCAGLVAHGNRALSERGVAKQITLSRPDAVPTELAGPYDGAIVGSGGYMHLVGRARRVAFLQQLRARLRPGAPILLSFFFRNADPDFHTVASLANAMRIARGRRDPIEVGDRWWRGTYCHFFTYDEIGLELALGGFDLERFELEPRAYAVGRALSASP